MQIIDYCVLFSTILVVILIGWLSGRNTCCTDSSKEFLLTEKGINKLQAGFSMAATDFWRQRLGRCNWLLLLCRDFRHMVEFSGSSSIYPGGTLFGKEV